MTRALNEARNIKKSCKAWARGGNLAQVSLEDGFRVDFGRRGDAEA